MKNYLYYFLFLILFSKSNEQTTSYYANTAGVASSRIYTIVETGGSAISTASTGTTIDFGNLAYSVFNDTLDGDTYSNVYSTAIPAEIVALNPTTGEQRLLLGYILGSSMDAKKGLILPCTSTVSRIPIAHNSSTGDRV